MLPQSISSTSISSQSSSASNSQKNTLLKIESIHSVDEKMSTNSETRSNLLAEFNFSDDFFLNGRISVHTQPDQVKDNQFLQGRRSSKSEGRTGKVTERLLCCCKKTSEESDTELSNIEILAPSLTNSVESLVESLSINAELQNFDRDLIALLSESKEIEKQTHDEIEETLQKIQAGEIEHRSCGTRFRDAIYSLRCCQALPCTQCCTKNRVGESQFSSIPQEDKNPDQIEEEESSNIGCRQRLAGCWKSVVEQLSSCGERAKSCECRKIEMPKTCCNKRHGEIEEQYELVELDEPVIVTEPSAFSVYAATGQGGITTNAMRSTHKINAISKAQQKKRERARSVYKVFFNLTLTKKLDILSAELDFDITNNQIERSRNELALLDNDSLEAQNKLSEIADLGCVP